MNKLLNVYKPIGLTPLQVITKIRKKFPQYKNEKIGYAGRLDPLAHGVLLLMIGEATKNRDQYLSLPKSYEFEVLFGLQTDTYDVLGLLQSLSLKPAPQFVNLFVNTFVNTHTGIQLQPYPPYSSKAVKGKPLFWWAKKNKLDQIKIPQREIEITNFEVISFQKVSSDDFQKRVFQNIACVNGDFRQEEIKKQWNIFFKKNPKTTFLTATFHIDGSSGTYIRGLVYELGKKLGCGAIATDILRTRVSKYDLPDSLRQI